MITDGCSAIFIIMEGKCYEIEPFVCENQWLMPLCGVCIITRVLIWGKICPLGFSDNKRGWHYNRGRGQYIERALYVNIQCGILKYCLTGAPNIRAERPYMEDNFPVI